VLKTAGATYNRDSVTWVALARVAMLCNRAEFKQDQERIPVIKRSVYINASAFIFFCDPILCFYV